MKRKCDRKIFNSEEGKVTEKDAPTGKDGGRKKKVEKLDAGELR